MKSLVIAMLPFLLANLFVLGAPSPHNNTDLLECLIFQSHSSSLQSELIYTPENPLYSSIFQSTEQNLRPGLTSKYRPLVIITPIRVSEIQAAIYCSKQHGVLMKVRSGGHDYEGLSYTSFDVPFVLVDMRNFRSISINLEDNTAWVEAGVTLGELYHAIAEKSSTLAFPAGACATVGVGGHFLGGGYGMISRKHGLSIDNVIDAKVIDVDGRVLDRKSMGEDLFWAIRGGGGTSFGIVLAFKLRLIVVPELVTIFNVTKTLEQNATQLIHKWQYIADKIDENLVIRPYVTTVISPKDGKRRIEAYFRSLFLGRAKDLVLLMQEKFPELGLVEHDCIEMPWIGSALFFAGFENEPVDVLLERSSSGMYLKGKSDYVTQPIPEYGLTSLWKFLNEEEVSVGGVTLSPFGGILSTISDSETPFPHRAGNIYMIHYDAYWIQGDSIDSQRHVNWIRRLYSYMTPFVSNSPRAAYLNYRDLDIGSINNGNMTSYELARSWGFKYFKNNFDRLVRVKTRVDPNNFFRNEQSIPPLSPHASRAIRLNVEDTHQQTNVAY